MIKEELLAILACPKCKGPLVCVQEGAREWLDCSQDRLRYPIKNDIPMMLVEEAKSY